MNNPISAELQLFVEDALEVLDACDHRVLDLDQALSAGEPPPKEVLNTLFRGVHTVKGNAGMLGIAAVVDVTHAQEELLERLRGGHLTMTRALFDLLLGSLDALRTVILQLKQGTEGQFDANEVIAALRAHIRGPLDGSAWVAARFPGWYAPELAIGALEALESSENHLYVLRCEAREAFAERPLEDPELEKYLMIGHAVSWRLAEEGVHEIGYLTAASGEILERFRPPHLLARRLWEASEEPARLPEAKTEVLAVNEGESSIRVGIALLDKLMNLVGELVLTRNQILQHVGAGLEQHMVAPSQRLNLITTELQEAVMRTRMQHIGQIWDRFPRQVRDYSRQSGKQIQLVQEGADTELDKSLLEMIKDPLTHLVRNAMDHGIEPPAQRLAAGKSAQGTIHLLAYHNGGQIVIEIKDDGQGLDYERIRQRALQKGLVSPDQVPRMGEAELAQLIFQPGFSTAEQVTNISGRGVGMDVVRANIERIGGTIELASTRGRGSTITLRVPLTLAVIPALIIIANGERYAIPQTAVLEVVATGDGLQRVEQFAHRMVFRLRDSLIPVVSLRAILGWPAEEEVRYLVVLQAGTQVFGLSIDAIGDTEEIVVKSLHAFIQGLDVYAGVTIMGDGKACMILDAGGLASVGGIEQASQAADHDGPPAVDAALQRMLLCRIGDRTYAVPMAIISRLEVFPSARLERLRDRLVVQYGEGILPIAEPAVLLGVRTAEEESTHVVVIGEGPHGVGLKVSAILDIVEQRLKVHDVATGGGVAGAAVINGQTVEVLDVYALLDQSFPEWFDPGKQAPSAHRRLLLVEDSSFFRSMLRSHLEQVGYEVVEAGSGEQGLAALQRDAFDVVLSDIELPQIDGLSMIRSIRENPAWRNLPCVALTSLDKPEMKSLALEAGFDAFETKYQRDSLLATLARAIQQASRTEVPR